MVETTIEGPLMKCDSRFAVTHDMPLLCPLLCCSTFPSLHELFIFHFDSLHSTDPCLMAAFTYTIWMMRKALIVYFVSRFCGSLFPC
jgi:hypothetical protein